MRKMRSVIISLLVVLICCLSVFSTSAQTYEVGDSFADGVIVSEDESYCGCCHEHNHSGFFGKLSCFFCKIISFFKRLFGKGEENPVHKYVLVSERAATCAVNGNQVYACLVCDQTQTLTFEKTEHTPVVLAAKPATCTQTGLTEGSRCSSCRRVLVAQKRIPMLSHEYDDGIVSAEPTCEAEGAVTYTCTFCGATKIESVSANGHTLVDVSAQAATCEAVGWKTYKHCSVCDYTTYDELPALGHNYAGVVTTAPTCTEKGIQIFTCANDASHTYIEEVDANGHTIVTVSAQTETCEAIGWNAYEYCSVCDYTTYTEIPAAGHTSTADAAVAPTCTATGLTEGSHCAVCTKILVAQTVVAANGHSYDDGAVTAEPTCTATGVRIYTCSVCSATKTESIPANGHSYSDATTYRCYPYNDPAGANKLAVGKTCTVCSYYNKTNDLTGYTAIVQNADTTAFYETVESALAASVSGDTVVVIADTTLTQSATVPAGVTLLIPCDNAMTVYMENGYNPDTTNKNGVAALYRTLTVQEGVTLSVNGTLLVNAVTGRPEAGTKKAYDNSGYYGQIALAGNIVVNSGGIFDCAGFVNNNGGLVTLTKGSTMYETYAVQKWRGGTYAACYVYMKQSFYPIYESHMNNMQADLRVEYGAILSGTVKMYGDDTSHYCRFPQIDNSNGIIRLAENAYVLREIDTVNDREIYSLYGDTTLSKSSMQVVLKGISMTLSTDKCVHYAFDGDMTFNFYAGTHTVSQCFAFLPGGEVNLYEGANVVCGSEAGFSMFDNGFYSHDEKCMSAAYQYTKNRPNAKLTMHSGSVMTVAEANAELFGDVYVSSQATLTVGDSAAASYTFKIPNDDSISMFSGTTGNYVLDLNRIDIE